MLIAPKPKDPVVFSYLALRKAVGIVALGLPFVLVIVWWLLRREVESSISGYYYTGMRNIFVGSLCAIGTFMLCCRGYDRKDEVAAILSALLAFGVAFFPTSPGYYATQLQHRIGTVHYMFAALLFSILAYFCLVLFKMTAKGKRVTERKRQRNRVYTVCGYVIIGSILSIVVSRIFNISHLLGAIAPVFFFETTALIAFGIAWLTKGETFLKDEESPGSNATFSLSTGKPAD